MEPGVGPGVGSDVGPGVVSVGASKHGTLCWHSVGQEADPGVGLGLSLEAGAVVGPQAGSVGLGMGPGVGPEA